MKILCKDFHYKGHDYVLLTEDDGYVRAIDYKYLNEKGELTQVLNGLQMFVDTRNNSVGAIMERITRYWDFQEYLDTHNVDRNDDRAVMYATAAFYGFELSEEAES